jgi:ABC-type antimicrobial peptide transport system permease subunit
LPDLGRPLRLLAPLADEALTQLRAGWRQQVLTLLGIVWGAAVVILLLSLGAGFYQFIDLGFKKTGDRYTSVDASFTSTEQGGARPGRKIVLEREDVERIRASAPAAGLVGAQYQRASVARTPRRTRSTVVCAATPDVRRIKVHQVERGRYFDDADDAAGRLVAVLGANLVETFFVVDDPVLIWFEL